MIALSQPEQRPIVDIIAIHERFAWKHVLLKPYVKRHFISKATKERHSKVSVRVDEPGHDQILRRIEDRDALS